MSRSPPAPERDCSASASAARSSAGVDAAGRPRPPCSTSRRSSAIWVPPARSQTRNPASTSSMCGSASCARTSLPPSGRSPVASAASSSARVRRNRALMRSKSPNPEEVSVSSMPSPVRDMPNGGSPRRSSDYLSRPWPRRIDAHIGRTSGLRPTRSPCLPCHPCHPCRPCHPASRPARLPSRACR